MGSYRRRRCLGVAAASAATAVEVDNAVVGGVVVGDTPGGPGDRWIRHSQFAKAGDRPADIG